MAEYRDRIQKKLSTALSPVELVISDDSHLHAGHAGAHIDGRGETHFSIRIVSDAFDGETRVARHRRIYAILASELKERVHALSLTTLTELELNS
ncbi:MAG: BolA family protein [Rhodospirillaceae bacterium]